MQRHSGLPSAKGDEAIANGSFLIQRVNPGVLATWCVAFLNLCWTKQAFPESASMTSVTPSVLSCSSSASAPKLFPRWRAIQVWRLRLIFTVMPLLECINWQHQSWARLLGQQNLFRINALKLDNSASSHLLGATEFWQLRLDCRNAQEDILTLYASAAVPIPLN